MWHRGRLRTEMRLDRTVQHLAGNRQFRRLLPDRRPDGPPEEHHPERGPSDETRPAADGAHLRGRERRRRHLLCRIHRFARRDRLSGEQRRKDRHRFPADPLRHAEGNVPGQGSTRPPAAGVRPERCARNADARLPERPAGCRVQSPGHGGERPARAHPHAGFRLGGLFLDGRKDSRPEPGEAAVAPATGKEADEGVYAAIAAALDLYLSDTVHDAEPFVITLRPKASAWNDKRQNFRKLPK